jgi:CRP-like cAMP-binding protein
LKRGEIQKEMGFVCKGLLRRYFINEKGNEKTTGFTRENEFVTDYPAFIRQKPTKYFLQCLEPSLIIKLSYKTIQESYEKFKNSETQGRLIAEKVLIILSDRVEGFLFTTAEERYLKFISENPELIHRISLTHLSSFLGIERQSLSRIRKRITRR